MTEEETLAKAYAVLGIDGGSTLETINLRWKRLAMVWHSDRFPTEDGKAYADEELKKINNARDVLKKHFATDHSENSQCACKPRPGSTSQSSHGSGRTGTGHGPGPGKRRTTQETNAAEEAEAKQRNAERARAAEEARQTAANEAAAKAAQTAASSSAGNLVEQIKSANDEALRWRVALGIGAAWIALSLFGCVGMGAKHWWHDTSFKLQNMFPAHTDQTGR